MSEYGLRRWVIRLFQIYRYYRRWSHSRSVSARAAFKFAGDPYYPEE